MYTTLAEIQALQNPSALVADSKKGSLVEQKMVLLTKLIDNRLAKVIEFLSGTNNLSQIMFVGELESMFGQIEDFRRKKAITSREYYDLKEHAFEHVLKQIAASEIRDLTFHRRILTLLSQDNTFDNPSNEPYSQIKEILNKLLESEDSNERELAISLLENISSDTMINILEMPDVDDCTPDRMSIYIKRAADRLGYYLKLRSLGDYPEYDEVSYSRLNKLLFEFNELLGHVIERDNDEHGFIDDISSSPYFNENVLEVIKNIADTFDAQYDNVNCFLVCLGFSQYDDVNNSTTYFNEV